MEINVKVGLMAFLFIVKNQDSESVKELIRQEGEVKHTHIRMTISEVSCICWNYSWLRGLWCNKELTNVHENYPMPCITERPDFELDSYIIFFSQFRFIYSFIVYSFIVRKGVMSHRMRMVINRRLRTSNSLSLVVW